MSKLSVEINKIKRTHISKTVNQRLREFRSLGRKGNDEWFSEMCFCILTANSKASTAIEIQKELGAGGFLRKARRDVVHAIKRNKHRFHNNKAKFICEARAHRNIKSLLKNSEIDPREWLVANVKGLGWKEASHFLRNVGYVEYAILDRHIVNLMFEYGLIKEKPKTLTRKIYLKIESVFLALANRQGMNAAELDLYMWFLKTGKVLK